MTGGPAEETRDAAAIDRPDALGPDVSPRELRRISRRRHRRVGTAQFVIALIVILVVGYESDVAKNRLAQANASVSVAVQEAADHPEYADDDRSAAVFFDGFGTYNSDHLARTLGPGVQGLYGGETWSVSYGNAPLASDTIAEQVLDLAEQRDKRELDLVGYSMGGIINLEVAAILSSSPEVTVRSITLISSPDGIEGLRPLQRQEMDAAELVSQIPGAQYSTALRFVGEMYFMRDRYTTGGPLQRIDRFFGALTQARVNLSGPTFPGTWLLVDQAFAIGSADLAGELRTISENTTPKGPRPSVLYLGTGAPGRDYMVDDAVSSANICSYAAQNAMQCTIRKVPGAVHTAPERTRDAYDQTLADVRERVRGSIEQAAALFLLRSPATPDDDFRLLTDPDGAWRQSDSD